ncbi:methyltransferase domain-containing protein [Candidatus Kaiserbacteria bacterium]|nr:methyltransferase domain-containing protein [Candidatus Kaiserbacteria bacterium]USN91978.1 MAG: methyltransferase domain-containing protein [Candidatus Nomurabacteria bacterium]
MPMKPNFIKKKKRKVHGATFWDQEYTDPGHLKLSEKESQDLVKFTRWLIRRERADVLTPPASVVDVGCGNGRNLIYLARQFGLSGIGIDVSGAAISQAKKSSLGLQIEYSIQSGGDVLPTDNESQALALDMMTSHFLNKNERVKLRDEIYRTLRPGGFFFMKTFLKDKDIHTARMIDERPGEEEGSYIHPVMGVAEYVYSEEELVKFLSEKFIVHKIYRSHKHTFKGRARKRRTISVYAEKDYR